MARPPRIHLAGLTHHVINRGNNRCDIFRAERDYVYFLTSLRHAAEKHHVDVHSYTLMTNHFHFIATPRIETGLSRAMHLVGTAYAGYFNRRYARTGRLFEGPFRSSVIDTETYWFTCMRYVELNPVRAALVSQPSDYRWSSYRANALGDEDEIIVPHALYLALGSTTVERQENWRDMCREAVSPEDLFEIRDGIRCSRVLANGPAIRDGRRSTPA